MVRVMVSFLVMVKVGVKLSMRQFLLVAKWPGKNPIVAHALGLAAECTREQGILHKSELVKGAYYISTERTLP